MFIIAMDSQPSSSGPNMRYNILVLMIVVWTGLMAPATRAATLFEESWPSSIIDTGKWNSVTSKPEHVLRLESVGNGDYALVMANSLSDWGEYILSRNSFSRGQNLRVTFKCWGDDSRVSGLQRFPGAAGICGPWHSSQSSPIYATLDEGIGYVWSALTFNEAPGRPDVSALHDRLHSLSQRLRGASDKGII